MYYIGLYEEGRLCTQVGGEIPTLPQAIDQMRRIASIVKAEEVEGCFGYKFDRQGTLCALVVLDRFGFPIYDKEEEL